MELYIIIGVIGIALLVVGLVFDGVGDAFDVFSGWDAADGALSLTAVGSALTLAGVGGFASLTMHLWWPIAAAVAVALGALGMFMVARITRALKRHSSAPALPASEGSRGHAVGPISPRGEIKLAGELNKRLAVTRGPAIADGTPVRVVGREEPFLMVIADEPATGDTPSWPHPTNESE